MDDYKHLRNEYLRKIPRTTFLIGLISNYFVSLTISSDILSAWISTIIKQRERSPACNNALRERDAKCPFSDARGRAMKNPRKRKGHDNTFLGASSLFHFNCSLFVLALWVSHRAAKKRDTLDSASKTAKRKRSRDQHAANSWLHVIALQLPRLKQTSFARGKLDQP